MLKQRILFTVLAAAALATPAMIAPAIFTPAAAQASLNIGLSVPGPAVPFYRRRSRSGLCVGRRLGGYGYRHWEGEHRGWEHRHWREERHHGTSTTTVER